MSWFIIEKPREKMRLLGIGGGPVLTAAEYLPLIY